MTSSVDSRTQHQMNLVTAPVGRLKRWLRSSSNTVGVRVRTEAVSEQNPTRAIMQEGLTIK